MTRVPGVRVTKGPANSQPGAGLNMISKQQERATHNAQRGALPEWLCLGVRGSQKAPGRGQSHRPLPDLPLNSYDKGPTGVYDFYINIKPPSYCYCTGVSPLPASSRVCLGRSPRISPSRFIHHSPSAYFPLS